MNFVDTTANFFSQPAYCGARIYSFSPTLPSFLTMNNSTGILSLATSNTAYIGTYTYTMTESMASYPLVTPIVQTFTVTITCSITSFTISTAVVNFNYKLNSGNVVSGPFTPVQVNPCNYPVTYSVEHLQGTSDLGSAMSLFSTSTLSYTHSFTDPLLIGTV